MALKPAEQPIGPLADRVGVELAGQFVDEVLDAFDGAPLLEPVTDHRPAVELLDRRREFLGERAGLLRPPAARAGARSPPNTSVSTTAMTSVATARLHFSRSRRIATTGSRARPNRMPSNSGVSTHLRRPYRTRARRARAGCPPATINIVVDVDSHEGSSTLRHAAVQYRDGRRRRRPLRCRIRSSIRGTTATRRRLGHERIEIRGSSASVAVDVVDLHRRRRAARRRGSQRVRVRHGGARLGDRVDRGRRAADPARAVPRSVPAAGPGDRAGVPRGCRDRLGGPLRLRRRAARVRSTTSPSEDRRSPSTSRPATTGSVTSPASSGLVDRVTELTERLQDQVGTPSDALRDAAMAVPAYLVSFILTIFFLVFGPEMVSGRTRPVRWRSRRAARREAVARRGAGPPSSRSVRRRGAGDDGRADDLGRRHDSLDAPSPGLFALAGAAASVIPYVGILVGVAAGHRRRPRRGIVWEVARHRRRWPRCCSTSRRRGGDRSSTGARSTSGRPHS